MTAQAEGVGTTVLSRNRPRQPLRSTSTKRLGLGRRQSVSSRLDAPEGLVELHERGRPRSLYSQSLANISSNSLRQRARNLSGMPKTAAKVLAENLKRLIATEKPGIPHTQLGKLAGIAANSVSYMVDPTKRPVPKDGGEPGSARQDQIEKLAAVFGREAWQVQLNRETVGDQIFAMLWNLRPVKPPPFHAIHGNKDNPPLPLGPRQKIPDKTSKRRRE